MNGKCPSRGHIDPLEQARSIITEIAAEHQIPRTKIVGRDRHGHIVAARRCAIRRIRDETNLTLAAIGYLFDRLHYSTIFHYLNVNGREAIDAAAATSRQAQG